MATNVIHGTGKPRFVLPSEIIHSNTVKAATTTQVTLNTAVDLTTLDNTYGLIGMQVSSYNATGGTTRGAITAFNDTDDILTVDSWSNLTPNVGAAVWIQGRVIDLPYCQRLTESFSPDYITKKMLNGEIRFIKRGFYYRASLDYTGYLHKDEMEIIRHLYESTMNGCGFYPRKDNTSLYYAVDIDPESEINFYQLQRHQGHGGVVINIKGIQRLARIPFNDPTQLLAGVVTDDTGQYVTDDQGQFVT